MTVWSASRIWACRSFRKVRAVCRAARGDRRERNAGARAAVRSRDRIIAGRAADTGTGGRAVPDQRDHLRAARTSRDHLIVVGGGPIGLELAQAHRQLGAKVTVLEAMQIMGPDDRDLVAVVRARLEAEGIEIHEGSKVVAVKSGAAGITVSCAYEDREFEVTGSHILVAAGRSPNLSSLDLDAAGIVHDRRGIEVDARLRTTNKRVFAVGDVAGKYQFTHIAGYHAGGGDPEHPVSSAGQAEL